jgi:hypothetical protein
MHACQPANTLGLSGPRVKHHIAGFETATVETNESKLPRIGIVHRFEGKRRTNWVTDLPGLCVTIRDSTGDRLHRRREVRHDRVQQWLDAFVAQCRATHHWEEGNLMSFLAYGTLNFFFSQRLAAEVFFQ